MKNNRKMKKKKVKHHLMTSYRIKAQLSISDQI